MENEEYLNTFWRYRSRTLVYFKVEEIIEGGIVSGTEASHGFIASLQPYYMEDLLALWQKVDVDDLINNKVFDLVTPEDIVRWKMK